MAVTEIISGVCGFKATVRARMQGRRCTLDVESDCEAIQRLAADLQKVDPFREISFRGEGPLTLKMGARHCYHPACPVPVGIIKTVEVAAGSALPVDASIKPKSDA